MKTLTLEQLRRAAELRSRKWSWKRISRDLHRRVCVVTEQTKQYMKLLESKQYRRYVRLTEVPCFYCKKFSYCGEDKSWSPTKCGKLRLWIGAEIPDHMEH